MAPQAQDCHAAEKPSTSTAAMDDQTPNGPPEVKDSNHLTGGPLIRATLALNFSNAVAFSDSLALGSVLPLVAKHFNGNDIIEFAPTAQLIGATVGQCVLGYFSDVYSRRSMLLVALGLHLITSILCAVSSYSSGNSNWGPGLFTVARVLAGVSLGSVSNLVNISQNDILPERKRLTFQGIQGISVALGSTLGILVGAHFATQGHWEFFYYVQAGLCAVAAGAIYFCVPAQRSTSSNKSIKDFWKTIDYFGILSGTVAVVCGLLVLCQNSTFSTAGNVALGCVAALAIGLFILSGFRNSPGVRHIIPFRLFKNRTVAAIYAQNVLFGATYYTFIYFTPVTLKAVREIPLLQASEMLLPYFFSHAASSTLSAFGVRALKDRNHRSYSYMFFFAFSIWTLAMGLLAWDSKPSSHSSAILALGALVGLGTGATFQNSVMAITAQVRAEDRAVAIGARNVLRYFGGALGTAVSTMIIQKVLIAELPKELEGVAHGSIFDLGSRGLSSGEMGMVRGAYAEAVRVVYFVGMGLIALCLVLNFLVRDQPMRKVTDPETLPEVAPGKGSESSTGASTPASLDSVWEKDSGSSTPGSTGSLHGKSLPRTPSLRSLFERAMQKLERE